MDQAGFKVSEATRDELVMEIYRQCFASKHHYDNLSWLIGAPIFAIAGAALVLIQQIESDSTVWQVLTRLTICAFSIGLLFFWMKIYERNRLWGEVANEKLRDIERDNKFSGIGIEFMKVQRARQVVLKNLDEHGDEYMDPALEPKTKAPRSMHLNIPTAVGLYCIGSIASCFFPS